MGKNFPLAKTVKGNVLQGLQAIPKLLCFCEEFVSFVQIDFMLFCELLKTSISGEHII